MIKAFGLKAKLDGNILTLTDEATDEVLVECQVTDGIKSKFNQKGRATNKRTEERRMIFVLETLVKDHPELAEFI